MEITKDKYRELFYSLKHSDSYTSLKVIETYNTTERVNPKEFKLFDVLENIDNCSYFDCRCERIYLQNALPKKYIYEFCNKHYKIYDDKLQSIKTIKVGYGYINHLLSRLCNCGCANLITYEWENDMGGGGYNQNTTGYEYCIKHYKEIKLLLLK